MKDIKEIVKEYKEFNGNANIPNKDLLFYIIKKVDWLVDNKIDKKTFWVIIGAGGAFMLFLLKEIIQLKGGVIL